MTSALFHHARCPRCALGTLSLTDYNASGHRVYVCSLGRCRRRFHVVGGQLEEMPKGKGGVLQ
jgi:hypothetical protein